ncbi:MAG: hypothetical protein K2X98_05025, partial [Alphaproteobacteria bacterium]|nr:hypothetical protein [Alphaproteobacteria bacterium]
MTPTFVSPLLTDPIRYGVGTIDIAQMEKKVGQTLAALWNDHNPDYECLHCVDDAIDILDTIKKNINLLHFDRLIVLGMGASINNPRAVLVESNIHDIMMRKVVFVDNLDENAIMNSTKGCDPVKCGFLVISKSGTTLETTALALAARKWILNHDLPVEDHMLMMTELNDSPLRRLAQYDGLKHTFTHPPMGGRFAVFTVVTLVPGLFAGLDMRRFLEGASVCLKEAKDKGAQSSVGQAVQFHIHSQNVGRHLHVLEAYDGCLSSLAQWWCQMWAESLGKNSEAVTPIHSLGPFDHHSQWQLYLSALQNKCF